MPALSIVQMHVAWAFKVPGKGKELMKVGSMTKIGASSPIVCVCESGLESARIRMLENSEMLEDMTKKDADANF
jgi:hypothetical protein